MKNNRIFIFVLIAGVIIAAAEAAYLYSKRDRFLNKNNSVKPTTTSTPTAELYMRKLDGVLVANLNEVDSGQIGVMIDNHPVARPQSGLSQAKVVYEVPVEGGITRFFAFFDVNDSVAKVGPVRSARPYFLDWLAEYGSTSFWHAGGSKEALDQIKQYKVWDVNEFYYGPYFWRGADREAPHNLYTSSDKWKSLVTGTPKAEKEWKGWLFGPVWSSSFTISDVGEIQIKYESNYTVAWVYDEAAERYVRYQNAIPTLDQSGSQVYADTVVVQEVDVEVVDNEGRKEIDTIGKGDARVLVHGKAIRGYWKKDSRTDRTRFYDLGNREIPLHPGKIWIEVIPQNTPMEVSS